MIFLYNFAFLIFAVFYLPVFVFKLRQEKQPKRLIMERLGLFSKTFREQMIGKKTIWIHAVSVGEVLVAQRLLPGLLARFPQYHILLTTVTPTGQSIARAKAEPRISVSYFPFDWTPCVRNFFQAVGPDCLILIETEIWPNLLLEAKKHKVPVTIVNARLSEKSARRYVRYGSFFRKLFGSLQFVGVQSPEDGERFEMAGVAPEQIQVLGNMKFDNPDLEKVSSADEKALRAQWNFSSQDLIWVAGSTHEGEEKIILSVYSDLKQHFKLLKLLIAPRHIERAQSIRRLYSNAGWATVLSSELSSDFDVLILNQLGILKRLYQMADIVFTGGSLVQHGGQNPIEAAVFKKAIVHGPHVMNFKAVYRMLDQEGGALPVRDEEQLRYVVSRLLPNSSEREKLGHNAYQVVQRLRGVTDGYLNALTHFFEPSTTTGKEISCQIR